MCFGTVAIAKSSCPALCRASTSLQQYPRKKDVDDRDKPGMTEQIHKTEITRDGESQQQTGLANCPGGNAVIVGSRWSRSAGAFLMGSTMRQRHGL